jgi:cytochrome P450
MNSQIDPLRALLDSIDRDGLVVHRPGGDVGIFDPAIAARVEAANTEALYVGDSLIDRLRRRGTRSRVPWSEIRAALTEQNRRLAEPRHVEALHQRMRDFLRAHMDRDLDLTLLVGRTVAFALIPQIIDGLPDADVRLLESQQEMQIRKFLAPERTSICRRLTNFIRLRRLTRIFSTEVRRRLGGQAPPREDFLQSLLPFADRLGVNRVAYLVTTVLTAASVAPEFTASCLVYAMHRHPEWRERIEQEMAVLEPHQLYSLSIEKLPSTLRFIKEATRIWPFPFLVTRTAARDIKVAGVEVPRGARYDLSAYVLHHLDDYWQDADRFDPDRWASPRKKATKGTYVPFGFAPRSCVGGSVAHALLLLICELFTRSFKVEMAKGASPRLTMPGIAVPVEMIGRITVQ